MDHLNVNWLAIVVATVASMALGMAWYMALSKQWLDAQGKTREDITASGNSPAPFIWAAACQLVIAYFIAMLTASLYPAAEGATVDLDIWQAMSTGAHMWAGFMLTAMIINHRYQMQKWSLTFIDAGYLLGVCLVQGLVIGLLA